MKIDSKKWEEEYVTLCQVLLGFDQVQAAEHLASAPGFDIGYSPAWYIREELNCGYVKKM